MICDRLNWRKRNNKQNFGTTTAIQTFPAMQVKNNNQPIRAICCWFPGNLIFVFSRFYILPVSLVLKRLHSHSIFISHWFLDMWWKYKDRLVDLLDDCFLSFNFLSNIGWLVKSNLGRYLDTWDHHFSQLFKVAQNSLQPLYFDGSL